MIKPEMVPKGSATAVHELFEPGYLESIGLHPESIIAAALNAWPGMKLDYWSHIQGAILLPLTQTQEDGDAA